MLLKRLFLDGPRTMVVNPQMSFVPLLALLGVAWAVVFRKRWFIMPSIWLVSLLLMFNFMTCSFSSYKPLPLFDRYLFPILLPSLVLLGYFVAALLAGDGDLRVGADRCFWAVVLIVGFCGISVFAGQVGIRFRVQQLERDVAARLGEKDVIYTDYRTAATLVFFRTGTLGAVDSNSDCLGEAKPKVNSRGAFMFLCPGTRSKTLRWGRSTNPPASS